MCQWQHINNRNSFSFYNFYKFSITIIVAVMMTSMPRIIAGTNLCDHAPHLPLLLLSLLLLPSPSIYYLLGLLTSAVCHYNKRIQMIWWVYLWFFVHTRRNLTSKRCKYLDLRGLCICMYLYVWCQADQLLPFKHFWTFLKTITFGVFLKQNHNRSEAQSWNFIAKNCLCVWGEEVKVKVGRPGP